MKIFQNLSFSPDKTAIENGLARKSEKLIYWQTEDLQFNETRIISLDCKILWNPPGSNFVLPTGEIVQNSCTMISNPSSFSKENLKTSSIRYCLLSAIAYSISIDKQESLTSKVVKHSNSVENVATIGELEVISNIPFSINLQTVDSIALNCKLKINKGNALKNAIDDKIKSIKTIEDLLAHTFQLRKLLA